LLEPFFAAPPDAAAIMPGGGRSRKPLRHTLPEVLALAVVRGVLLGQQLGGEKKFTIVSTATVGEQRSTEAASADVGGHRFTLAARGPAASTRGHGSASSGTTSNC